MGRARADRSGEKKSACTFERKSMPIVAWYMLSKESYMKRVIREVLPTRREGSLARLH